MQEQQRTPACHPLLSFRGPMKSDRRNLDYNEVMPSKQYYVYILSNFSRTTLYCGITNDLKRRVWEHKNNLVKGFTQKYQIHDLVYYEIFDDPETAIEREKQIKNYSRLKKERIISSFNPKVEDLYNDIL